MKAEGAVGKTRPVSTVYYTDTPRVGRLLYRYVQGSTVFCRLGPAQATVERICTDAAQAAAQAGAR